MKARFFTRQDAVKIISMDGKVYIFLCLNEEVKKETYTYSMATDGKPVTQTVYEYDYAEIIEDEGVLDLNDVATNPENYLDYTPHVEEPDSLERHRADIDYIAMEVGVEL